MSIILLGKVSDSSSGETLPGASVFISDSSGKPTGDGSQTDNNGAYLLTVNPGQYITARYIGYEPETYLVQADDQEKSFELSVKAADINMVDIIDTRLKRVINWRGIVTTVSLLALSFGLIFGFGKKES